MSELSGKGQSKHRRWVNLLPATILLVLLVIPATGWLMVLQLRSLVRPFDALYPFFSPYNPRMPSAVKQRRNRIASENPDDYSVQLATALCPDDWQQVAPSLRRILPRFPDKPALYAHILRYAYVELGLPHRDEEYLIDGSSPYWKSGHQPLPKPELLHDLDHIASVGERLDPDNAYFPMMRAAFQFIAHRDENALASIERASKKRHWNDYLDDEVRSIWRLQEMVHGRQNAIFRALVYGDLRYLHMILLKTTAKIATYRAMIAEKGGDVEYGLSIRRSITHCANVMRSESRMIHGAVTARDIADIAMSRPGGGQTVQHSERSDDTAWRSIQRSRYLAYLSHIGQAGEGKWTQAAIEAADRASDFQKKEWANSPFYGRPMAGIIRLWIAGIVILYSVLCSLLLWGAAGLLSRTRIRWPGVLGLATIGVCLLVVGTGFLLFWIELHISMLSSEGGTTGYLGSFEFSDFEEKVSFPAACIAIPTVVLVMALIIAAVRRKAPAAVLSRTFFCTSLVLAIGYAGLLGVTAGQNARLSAGMEQSLQGEGPYLATLLGRTWPGAIP